jgi:hypothetical protein
LPPPLPFAMSFSSVEERPGEILALPNGFLRTIVRQRFGDELTRYALSVRLERVELARRLFYLLEAQPGHKLSRGVEVVERLVDARLLASLGTQRAVWKPPAARPTERSLQ